MKTPLSVIISILISVSMYGQNENPYSQFGYEATIMPEVGKFHDKFCIINTDTTSIISLVAVDAINRNIILIDKSGIILHVDTLNSYTTARWLSPDPAGQYASPYLGMGNSPHMSVDPDGAFNLGATLVGAGAGFAIGSLVGLAFDKDNWWKYGLAGAAIGGIAGAASGNIDCPGCTFGEKTRAEINVALTGRGGHFKSIYKQGRYVSYGPGVKETVTFRDAIWRLGSNVDDVDRILANTIVGTIRGLNEKDDNTVTVKTRVYGNTVVTDPNGNKVVNQEAYNDWRSNTAKVPRGVTSLTATVEPRYFVNRFGTLQQEGTYPYFSSRLEIAYAAKDGITSTQFAEKFISVRVKSVHRTYTGGRFFR